MDRRVVSSRSNGLIQRASKALASSGVTPIQISVFSAIAALLVPAGLFVLQGAWGVVIALAGIQLRLLANVLDGLVAVEGGKGTPTGALFNEFPDRVADSIILVSTGYATVWPELGWLSALLAALTAYVRVFGGALGQAQTFQGPMAKQHRMAVLSTALVLMLILGALHLAPVWIALILPTALTVIAVGSLATCWTRTQHIAQLLARKV